MTLRLLHGSHKNSLSKLEPQYIGGNNGSQDGVGINLTDSIWLSRHYAGDSGSVYILDVDTSDYITISDKHFLSEDKAIALKDKLLNMHVMIKYRLATDICGKQEAVFESDKEAEMFYKEKREEYRQMDSNLDRLKPEIDYNDAGDMVIRHARTDISDLTKVSTHRIHHCLNRLDNELASSLMKSITKGLILPRDNGTSNYLSFAFSEPVKGRLDQSFLNQPNANELIKETMARHSSQNTHNQSLALDNDTFSPT